jgi:hypothetical protein
MRALQGDSSAKAGRLLRVLFLRLGKMPIHSGAAQLLRMKSAMIA